jgi:hypothetical protein
MSGHHAEDPVAVLRRWEQSGAIWHVLAQDGDTVTIGLFTCDGGEEVSRFTSDDLGLLRFLTTG